MELNIRGITMENWQAVVSVITFVAVILAITVELLDLTVAALLGALVLVFTNIMSLGEAVGYIGKSHSTLGLFFGVMVLVRSFEPTNIFSYIATQIVILAQGSGRKLLLGIVLLVTPICAFLPNATTVMLLAPLIPPMAEEIGVNFVPLLILMVFVANSSGLLTLVGDPATFIVGDAVNISFIDYLTQLSLGGAIAVITVVVTLPILFRKIWRTNLENLAELPHPQINHPRVLMLGAVIVAFVLIFFIIGDYLPIPISPAAVALLGATLALLLAHKTRIDSVHNILRDVDWGTLIFFMSIFVLIGGLDKTGVINSLSGILSIILGKNILFASLLVLFVVGALSSVIPNIPLVVAMVPMIKQYIVNVGLAPAAVLATDFQGKFPPEVLPLFYAMMFGATLGGNGTLVGASSNIVAAGIAEQHCKRISFKTFLHYGIPITILQLITAALYVLVRFLL